MKTTIIDFDSLMYVWLNPNKVLDEFGQPTRTEDNSKFIYQDKSEDEVIASIGFVINDVMTKGGFDSYIGFIKGVNTLKEKRKYNPEYKSDRKTQPPKHWDFAAKYITENYNVFFVNDAEVDDAVISYKKLHPDYTICAIDSDILNTEGTHYNWKKNEWITTTKEEAGYAFWCSMITGSHNCVTGLPGKGIKYAQSIFLLHEVNIFGNKIASIIFDKYIEHYRGDLNKAISEYHKNYFSLSIIDNLELNYTIREWKTLELDIESLN
jgi:hypothetical protein